MIDLDILTSISPINNCEAPVDKQDGVRLTRLLTEVTSTLRGLEEVSADLAIRLAVQRYLGEFFLAQRDLTRVEEVLKSLRHDLETPKTDFTDNPDANPAYRDAMNKVHTATLAALDYCVSLPR
jgi:hypothetical protein